MLAPERRRRTPLTGVATSDKLRHVGTEILGYLKKIVNVECIQMEKLLSFSGVTDALRACDRITARKIVTWKEVLGIAENTYPHAEGVTFEEVTSGRPLSEQRGSHMTPAFIELSQAAPKYKAALEKAQSEETLPWHLVRQIINHPATI